MPITCLTPDVIKNLQAKVNAGEFNLEKMYGMDKKERLALFEKHVDKDNAAFIMREFDKVLAVSRKKSLKDWAQKSIKDPVKRRSIKNTIDELDDNEILPIKEHEAFFHDLVASNSDISASASEIKVITELSGELENLGKTRSSTGTPTKEYFKKRKELIKYVESRTPSSQIKVITSTISRGNMLASPKSGLMNIEGNIVQSGPEALLRRLELNQWRGMNKEYAKEYFKEVNSVFKESGYDISRMTQISDDTKILGEKVSSSQGPGAVRAAGRFYEDWVFHPLLGKPDVAFSSAHFADAANLNTTKIALQEGLTGDAAKKRALEIFKDATRIDPLTKEGEAVREFSIKNATRGTFTDETNISRFSLAAKKFLNDIPTIENVRLGDLLIPFAKTPANVYARTLEISGVTAPVDIVSFAKGVRNGDKEAIRRGMVNFARIGSGMTGAYVLANMIGPENYVGEYAFTSPSERALVKAEGAGYGSVKMAGHWVSLDYLGPLASPTVGMLNAMKYGKGLPDTLAKYFTGVLQQITRIPGVEEIANTFTDLKDYLDPNVEAPKMGGDALVGFMDFVAARIVPAFVSDVTKTIDDYERQVEFGTVKGALQKVQRKIPIASESLEPKIDMFGEKIETQSGLKPLLFGARLKKAKGGDLINELNRLSAGGHLPSLADPRFRSKKVKELKEKIGRVKFRKAFMFFGKEFKRRGDFMIKSAQYIAATEEEKRELLMKERTRALKEMISMYKNL